MAIQFTAASLPNKTGALVPDAEGYFITPVGALNTYNSSGEYYVAQGARDLFTASSIFMRRIESRRLKGECGHPKFLPSMTVKQYIERMMQIWEPEVDTFFQAITLDEDFGKKNPQLNNKDLVGVIARLTPSGPKSPGLRESLMRPGEDVCYSVRALTRDWYANGRNNRCIEKIFTYDHVTEPGVASAAKFNSAALESLKDVIVKEDMFEQIIDSAFMDIASEDSKELARECLDLFKSPVDRQFKRSFVELKVPTVLSW
jgi:hypothetical protein